MKNAAAAIYLMLIYTLALEGKNEFQNDMDADNCLICHIDMELLPEDYLEENIHQQAGIKCSDCHGGDANESDMEISMSAGRGYKGVPSKKEIPQLCGKCHSDINYMRQFQPRVVTDQVDQYYRSTHGKKLKEGDKNVAECVSCHSAHGILKNNDPRSPVYPLNVPGTCNTCHGDEDMMKSYGIASDQLERYSASVHGKALLEKKDIGAPACNDCHGNHGAVPPGYNHVSSVCGMCHVHNEEYFEESVMSESFKQLGYHGCEVCHNYHLIEEPGHHMLEEPCLECHSEDEDAIKTADLIRGSITAQEENYALISSRNDSVRNLGMNDEETEFILKDVRQIIIESRTLVHKFESEAVVEKSKEAEELLKKASALTEYELNEFDNRRIGFAYSSIAFFILIVGIWLKIKTLDSERNK